VAESAPLRLEGDLDARSVPALARRLRGQPLPAALALAGVTAIDSAGVAFLRTLQARAAAAGAALPLQHAPAHYHQLIAAHRVRPWE
jgi:ABC-type transporter Mla MlaB component